MHHGRIIHILFHEQAVCRRRHKNEEKKRAYLMSEGNIAMWFYHSLAGSETMSTLQREVKNIRSRMGFWDL